MKIFYYLIIPCLFLGSCKTRKEITSNNNEEVMTAKKNDNIVAFCIDKTNGIVWSEVTSEDALRLGRKFSDSFKVFMVNYSDLMETFKSHDPKEGMLAITIPMLGNDKVDCVTMELEKSNTMSPELQKKMNLYSYKGYAGNMTSARLDLSSESGLRGYFKKERQTILLETIRENDRLYYVLFDMKNATSEKYEFEK